MHAIKQSFLALRNCWPKNLSTTILIFFRNDKSIVRKCLLSNTYLWLILGFRVLEHHTAKLLYDYIVVIFYCNCYAAVLSTRCWTCWQWKSKKEKIVIDLAGFLQNKCLFTVLN